MKLLLLFVLFSVFSSPALSQSAQAFLQPVATANRTITGTVTFTPVSRGGVDVRVRLTGAVPRKVYSLEVHTLGDVTSRDGRSTGSLFKFDNQFAGCYPDPNRYEGALGNITANSAGNIDYLIYSELLSLSPIMPGYIVGRSVVLVDMASVCVPAPPATTAAPTTNATTTAPTTNSTTNSTAYLPTFILSQGVLGWIDDTNVPFPSQSEIANPNTQLICQFTQIQTYPHPEINGTVYFQAKANSSLIYVYVILSGLFDTEPYSMHIHQYGDISDSSGFNVGPHFNPTGVSHGCLDLRVHHLGDLANMNSDQNGQLKTVYTIANASLLPTDLTSLIGRALILNDGADDCAQNLNDYNRVGQCVIGRSEYVSFTLPGPSQLSSSQPIAGHISLFIIFVITLFFFY